MPTIDTRFNLLDAACGDLANALWRRLCNSNATPAERGELLQWENEGGHVATFAPAPAPANDAVWQRA
jgi:hypothetical protein